MSTEVLIVVISSSAALVSAIVGGVLVAIINNRFAKSKTDEEIKKLREETNKTALEAQKIQLEIISMSRQFEQLNSTVEDVVKSAGIKEKILFTMEQADIAAFEITNFCRSGREEDGIPDSTLKVKGNILLFEHKKTAGVFVARLSQYIIGEKIHEYIIGDETISGKRKIKVYFEIKTDRGACQVNVELKGKKTSVATVQKLYKITDDEWVTIETVLEALPLEEYRFSFAFYDMTEPQTVLIRNLRVSDRSI